MKRKSSFLSVLLTLFIVFTGVKARCVDIQEIDRIIDSLNNAENFNADILPKLIEIDSLSREKGYDNGIVYANIEMCYQFRAIDPEKVLHHITITDKILERNPKVFSKSNLVKHYLIKGYEIGNRGNSFQELNFYLMADSIALKDPTGELGKDVKFMLMNYYIGKSEYEKALKTTIGLISNHATDLGDERKKHSYLISLQNAGAIHLKLSNYDSTIYYCSLALDNGVGDYETGPWRGYLLLAEAHMELGDYEKTDYYLKQFESNKLEALSQKRIQYHFLYGDFESKKKKFDAAVSHYKMALDKADSMHWLPALERANYSLLKANLKAQNQPDLLDYLSQYDSLKSVFSNTTNSRYEQQLLVQFETSEKETKIAKLSEENTRKKYVIYRIVAFSALAVLALLIIVYRFKHRKKELANLLEREKWTKKVAETKLERSLQNVQNKAELIEQLKVDIQNYNITTVTEMSAILDKNYIDESDWAAVILHFDMLHDNFTKKINKEYPNLKITDIRLLVLVNLGYSNKGIAAANNISEDGVKKAKRRLRQKMEVEELPLVAKS